MSYITITRSHLGAAYENTVCMRKDECKALLPFIQKAYKEAKVLYDKYDDIRNCGEATERNINLLMKYSERVDHLESLLCDIKELISKS